MFLTHFPHTDRLTESSVNSVLAVRICGGRNDSGEAVKHYKSVGIMFTYHTGVDDEFYGYVNVLT